jgi:broad specificity phosphatase PhoE
MRTPPPLLRRFLLVLCLAAVPAAAAAQSHAEQAGAAPTTVIVVRHAEKATDDPHDPGLTAAGEARARTLLDVVGDAGVAAIFSTQFRRTRATVEPLARNLGLPVVVREAASGQAERYAQELAHEILATFAGRSVVVVGHSNTVPQIVHALSGHHVAEISEQEYDHLFVVVVSAGGTARLFRARYGAPDPAAP